VWVTEPCYFDPQGRPIELEQWAALLESPRRPTRKSHVNGKRLITVYLGIILPMTDMRLFGSAVFNGSETDPLDIVEVELYDSQGEAWDGHQRHLKAMREGFHCHQCRIGGQHV
jgi:hypothetical protein